MKSIHEYIYMDNLTRHHGLTIGMYM